MSGTAWDLELKGDRNFPGSTGRERLVKLAKELLAELKSSPKSADGVLHQAEDELTALKQRRQAVVERKNYTDLPARLRNEQLAVIDQHVKAFNSVKRNAQLC